MNPIIDLRELKEEGSSFQDSERRRGNRSKNHHFRPLIDIDQYFSIPPKIMENHPGEGREGSPLDEDQSLRNFQLQQSQSLQNFHQNHHPHQSNFGLNGYGPALDYSFRGLASLDNFSSPENSSVTTLDGASFAGGSGLFDGFTESNPAMSFNPSIDPQRQHHHSLMGFQSGPSSLVLSRSMDGRSVSTNNQSYGRDSRQSDFLSYSVVGSQYSYNVPRPRQSLRKNRRSPSGRYNSNVIRLSNNNLVDTRGLYKMALDVVESPEDIAWLDLSFNEIATLSEDVLEFPALKMLYLHGNKIEKFGDLSILTPLPNMYSLTLHGNPIENLPNYRSSIICMFPQLKNLDFAKVTEDEKDSSRLHIIMSQGNQSKKRSVRKGSGGGPGASSVQLKRSIIPRNVPVKKHSW